MIAERAFQALAQSGALRAHALEQAVAADDLLHCQRGGAGGGVAQIGVAMLEEARALFDGAHDALLRHDRADRLVAAARPLAMVMRSGVTPSCSTAYSVPLRPMPHMTSSAISSTPWRSQTSRTRRKYVDTAVTAPKVAPTTGSATKP